MKKIIVLAVSVLSLLGISFAIIYQVANLELLDRRGLLKKRGDVAMINDEKAPLSATFDEDVEDGGTRDDSNPEAPKIIESSKVESFFCSFSTLYDDETLTMGNKQFALRADLDGDKVKGSYSAWNYGKTDERRFETDESFMDELCRIIKDYDLAQYNGMDSETKGISDEYGATISVVFDSGESIYAADNAENFLPPDAEDAFVQLFASACAKGSEVIGVSVTDTLESVEVEGGSGFIRYPALTIGRNDAFGETDDLKYPAEDELRKAINEINADELEKAIDASERFGKGEPGKTLYYDADCFVTRNDTEVVSAYVKAESYEEAGQDREFVSYRTYNTDAETGSILTFRDTFREFKNLPAIIKERLEAEYPGHRFFDDSEELIRSSITDNDGSVCFALGNGFVHIFINEFVVNNEEGGYHLTLSLADYPELVSNFYVTYPDDTLTRLDYDTDYFISEDLNFRMECYDENGEDIYWRGIVGDNSYEATYYGHAPEAYLARKDRKNYLYLNLPAGDVSFHGLIYEIKDDGIEPLPELGDLGLTVSENTTLDPDYFLMNINEVIDGTVCFMYPTGAFKIDVDGFPVSVANEYRLYGSKVKIKESGRYNPKNITDAANSGGMFYVTEGTEVKPYASDLKSYIDFVTTDETEPRMIRFTINEFSADMKLDHFGKLNDVFKQ